MQTEQAFPAGSASVGAARRFVAEALASWGRDDELWVAALLVSELASNAVLHAGTPFTVLLSVRDGAVRLEVVDGVRRAPRQRRYGLDATTGRGIAMLATLSRDWGVNVRGSGKSVWCELEGSTGPDGSGRSESDAEPDLEAFLGPEDLDVGDCGRALTSAA